MKSEIQEESAFNDKVENHAIQYQEAGKLMSAENVIINRSLSKLNNTIEKVDRRIIFE